MIDQKFLTSLAATLLTGCGGSNLDPEAAAPVTLKSYNDDSGATITKNLFRA